MLVSKESGEEQTQEHTLFFRRLMEGGRKEERAHSGHGPVFKTTGIWTAPLKPPNAT